MEETLPPAVPSHHVRGGKPSLTGSDRRRGSSIEPVGVNREPSGRRLWLMVAGLVLVAVVVLFYKLGDFRTLGGHETYQVVPAREMLETGDWIVPRSGGLPRLRKPPLSYWVVAASVRLFGIMTEWTVRVPAAISALLLAILVGVWANRWYGRTAGLAAALVQLTSVWVIIYARKAEVDMLLCLLTTSAMFLISQQPPDENHRKSFLRWIGIFTLLSISWLAKFHFGPTMVLAPCLVYFVVQRRFRALWNLVNPIGLLILAAGIFVWPYLVLQQLPQAWDVWTDETVGRAVGSLGRMPVWFYAPYLISLPLPWTPFVYAAMPRSFRTAWREGDARERFLWVWGLVVLAIVTVTADKHKHYLNPLMPMFSLLAGQSFVAWSSRIQQSKPLVGPRSAVGWTLVLLAGSAAVSLVVDGHRPHLAGPVAAVCVVTGIGSSVVFWLLAFRKERAAGLTAVLVFLAVYVGVMGQLVPAHDDRRPGAQFAGEVRRVLTGRREIIAYRMQEKDPIVYYLDSPVSRLLTVCDVKRRLVRDGRVFLVTYEPFLADLSVFPYQRIVKRMSSVSTEPASRRPPLVLMELTLPAVAARNAGMR